MRQRKQLGLGHYFKFTELCKYQMPYSLVMLILPESHAGRMPWAIWDARPKLVGNYET
jgi:hypothetical protein